MTPQRIRVVTHPPLAPLRAWIPLTGTGNSNSNSNNLSTIEQLAQSVGKMLGEHRRLEVELQGGSHVLRGQGEGEEADWSKGTTTTGFALLNDSPLSVLDPVGFLFLSGSDSVNNTDTFQFDRPTIS